MTTSQANTVRQNPRTKTALPAIRCRKFAHRIIAELERVETTTIVVVLER